MGFPLTTLSKIFKRRSFSGVNCSNKGACMEYMSDLLLERSVESLTTQGPYYINWYQESEHWLGVDLVCRGVLIISETIKSLNFDVKLFVDMYTVIVF